MAIAHMFRQPDHNISLNFRYHLALGAPGAVQTAAPANTFCIRVK